MSCAGLRNLLHQPRALVLAALLIGTGIRVSGVIWGQGYSYFMQGDGVEAYSVAVDYGHGEARAAYLGQPNYNKLSKVPGPLWTIFCFLALRVGGSIQGVLWVIVLLNCFSIYLIYLLAHRTLGPPASGWAAMLAATLPWVVFYSSAVYNPEVMPFFAALLFLALWHTIRNHRARIVFWVPVLLLGMLQFHMSALMLIPAVVVIFWMSSCLLNWRWLGAGLIAGLALYLPYIRGDMANGWRNSIGMISGGSGYSFEAFKALTAPLTFLVNWAPRWTVSAADYRSLAAACFGSLGVFISVSLVSGLLAAFLITGAFQQIRVALRGHGRALRTAFPQSPGILFLATLTLVPLAVALLGGQPFHSRYCLMLLPALLPLAASAAAAWMASPRGRSFFLSAFVFTTCANVWLMPSMYHFQASRIAAGDLFIPSWGNLEEVYQKLKCHAGPGHMVRVDAAEYLSRIPPRDQARRDAALIARYVSIREKESWMRANPPAQPQPVTYHLRPSSTCNSGDPACAYAAHGIVLLALGPKH